MKIGQLLCKAQQATAALHLLHTPARTPEVSQSVNGGRRSGIVVGPGTRTGLPLAWSLEGDGNDGLGRALGSETGRVHAAAGLTTAGAASVAGMRSYVRISVV